MLDGGAGRGGVPAEVSVSTMSRLSRRTFLAAASTCWISRGAEAIIDIHQHTSYQGRTNEQLVAHQRKLGITKTVLLPAGSRFGLAAGAGRNQSVVELAALYPNEYVYFANEIPDLAGAKGELEKYLRGGAIGIGEQKFAVECDSAAIDMVAEVAAAFGVPVLMHFQHGAYNLGIERFHRVLERHPKVNFLGHAQTWWGNIDRHHDQTVMYPKTPVTPGGITDRLLSDYPNMYGDLSAGSGLNSMLRDEAKAPDFLTRHQNKLLFGSDCSDTAGQGEGCLGARILAAIRRLAPSAEVLRKLLSGNASRLLKIR